ncbi:MAG TPA: dihydropteroate synthase [Candidatus Methanomethylophilaceae archaeon]|nr:dihydropteroate synthase [Candidatus Methanomethylophilaceae archaeon]
MSWSTNFCDVMPSTRWKKGTITYDQPIIMGIVNVTPDSFSDGGIHVGPASAAEHAFRLIDDGAGMIDIGAESTRPGWKRVPIEEEMRRLIPVIKEVAPSCDVPISVDTVKTEVAEAALDAGADIINDVSGLIGRGMTELIASTGVPVIINHIAGTLDTMHSHVMSGDVLSQIKDYLTERVNLALDAGISMDKIILDPGIGFGKTNAQNEEILRNASYFGGEHPILIGHSRKRFLELMFDSRDDAASAKASVIAFQGGADIIRVHNVERTRDALQLVM